MLRGWIAKLPLTLVVLATGSHAEVVRIEVSEQRDWVPGYSSTAGGYESVTGTVWYEVDSKNLASRDITDIKLAPRNARGKVEFHGPFLIIRPKQAGKTNGTILFEVANRGMDQSNRILFQADRFDLLKPAATREVTHTPLFDRGYTFAWAGWQSDLDADAFGLIVPRAKVNSVIRGTDYLNVENNSSDSGSTRQGGSCAADVNDPTAKLRILRRFDDPGVIVPRGQWSFAKRAKDGKITADPCSFLLDKPVSGPALVSITYRGDRPQLAGLALAAVRDFNTYLRTHEIAGHPRPSSLIAYGYSQSARFLRDFLYRGFNRAADGSRVFDGILDTGGGAGRGSFDHRYASPGEAGNSVGSALRPVDLYPFADLPAPDIAGNRSEGLLDRARRDGVTPRMFHILSGSEYWARAASLMQATPDGKRALPEAPLTRTYVFAGTNHAPRAAVAFLRKDARIAYPYNDNIDEFTAMPALVEAMRNWIVKDTPPPDTQRPEVGTTLVDPTNLAFPKIPDVVVPKALPPLWQLNLGRQYRGQGILAEPPILGPRYTLLVPQVDEDGNEIGGWHGLRRSLPVGTNTAWNGSDRGYAGFGIISGLSGAFFPFPLDERAREARKDPRLSLMERYGSQEGYMRAADKEIDRQIAAGFLLPDERQWSRDAMLINWTRANILTSLWPTGGR